jgi:hypothetical protein
MHIHEALPACSAAAAVVSGAASSRNRAPSRRYLDGGLVEAMLTHDRQIWSFCHCLGTEP